MLFGRKITYSSFHFVACVAAVNIIILAELHADFFSRRASPLEAHVFVTVVERGDYVMFDEIYRRCSGKRQRRMRGGRSVQLPDWFMVLNSSSRHLSTYMYVLRTTKYVRPRKKKKLREVRSRDGHLENMCKISGSIS